MERSVSRIACTGLVVASFSFVLFLGTAQFAAADNVVRNGPNPIIFDAGTSNSELRVKVVSNSASAEAGDPVSGCNVGVKNDNKLVTVTLLISPSTGLVATPNPLIFDECGKTQTVTLSSNVGGTYTITAEAVDNTPEPGVYHYPFATLTVNVIDTTPPETTILTGPNDPTASRSAEFTFESTEDGTFECSLDAAAFESCSSPALYENLGVGPHTFDVRATDPSGNTDPTPATFTWTIKDLTITIDSISPAGASWGEEITVTGSADVVDVTGLDVSIDWGDGSDDSTGIVIAADGSWTATHTYASSNTYTITAYLVQGLDVKATDTDSVFINTREAILELTVPETVTGETKFVAKGKVKDAVTLEGIDGLEIRFSGDGEPDPVTSQGVSFFGDIVIESCDVHPPHRAPEPGECVADDIGDGSNSDNRVLHLLDGGTVTFSPSMTKVRVVLQDMGATSFTYAIKEYPDSPVECPNDPGEFVCSATSFSDAPLEILAKSGGSADGVTTYNGIKEISFGAGADIGISAFSIRNEDSNPQSLLDANFDDLDVGPLVSGFTVEPGTFIAYGVSQFDPANGLELVAELAPNSLYTATDASSTYNVVANLQSAGGVGAQNVEGSGTSIVKRGVTGDLDDDGLGDTDEGNCLARNPSNTAQTWIYAPSPSYSSTADCPKKGGVSGALPDFYVEFDCMNGVDCPTQAQLDNLELAFDGGTGKKINAHFHLSDTNVCSGQGTDKDIIAWTDGAGGTAAEQCDDFKFIKLNNFGTGIENDGCTLAGNCGPMIARAQAVGYVLIAHSVNGCSTTGIGELYGRDAIVGTDCIANVHAPTQIDNFRDGTILHELGHTLGLGHGGGLANHARDDTNCKTNHKSVMNYWGQVPSDLMPAGSASASSAVGWYLGYHRGEIRVGTTSGATTLDENNLIDSKLVMTGTWKNRDRVTAITSLKLMWGDLPSAVRTEFTGNTFIWDGGRSPNDPQINLNGIPDVEVNGFQLPACTESVQHTILQSPPDELVTMLNNVDEFQKTGTGIAALGVGGNFDTDQDPDLIPEQNIEGVVVLNSLDDFQFLGVKQPLNNIFFGEAGISQHKKGNTIPVQFSFLDEDGNEVTGTNALSEYGITRIDTKIALVTDFSTPPGADAYFTPQTSTQPGSADFFTWDGSKWSFNMGTKNLQTGGTYAGRIYLHFNNTPEVVILDLDGDQISYMFKVVKG